MNVSEVLHKIPYFSYGGSESVELTGIEIDSRKVKEGDIFVCIQGEFSDGHDYIKQAVDKGASLIVVEKELTVDIHANILRVSSTKRTLSQLAALFYQFPTQSFEVIGVTGTNGKTSTTNFLNQLYKNRGIKTGMIGTMYHEVAGVKLESKNTTPLAHELQNLLEQMKEAEVEKVFMEVSSHALSMGRVWGVDFKHAIFTNLTQDHLDYHGTMEHYKQAKGQLFSSLGYGYQNNKYAIFNADDETSQDYMKHTGAWVLTYGIENEADVKASNIVMNTNGMAFEVSYKNKTVHIQTKIIGLFNVYNLLAVISLCLADGWELEEISKGVRQLEPVKGRVEIVTHNKNFQVIVDYAHTPDGVRSVLKSMNELKAGRIITIVGCGGNRDKKKRPIMAGDAEQYSDFVILTSDNPRKEDPIEILKDMEFGMFYNNYKVIVDRESAIREAIEMAQEGDMIVILGKGHEEYQIIGDTTIDFSDVKVAQKYLG